MGRQQDGFRDRRLDHLQVMQGPVDLKGLLGGDIRERPTALKGSAGLLATSFKMLRVHTAGML